MTVENKPLRGHAIPAPLNRAQLQKSAPWLRLILGGALITYTSYTTVRGVGEDFAPLLQGSIGPLPLTLIGGLAAALLLSLGQWLTSESYPIVYSVLLLFDARYTQRQIGASVDALAAYHMAGLDRWIVSVVSLGASWGVSLLAARYGEILLLGKRAKRE